jgi:hypothetical protein
MRTMMHVVLRSRLIASNRFIISTWIVERHQNAAAAAAAEAEAAG